MGVRERIMTILLLEKVKANPHQAEGFIRPQGSEENGGE